MDPKMTPEGKIATLSMMCGMAMALNYTFRSYLESHEIDTEWCDELIAKLDRMAKDLFYPTPYFAEDKK